MPAYLRGNPNSRKSHFAPPLLALIGLAIAATMGSTAASAQRSGRQVVDSVCASCHGPGSNGAPRIGDRKAWAPRASQGLTALTAHALTGIRKMPGHGGNMALTDIEIERAITHMVNQSGGHWVEPQGGATPAVVRSGEQIVQMQCVKCHQDGVNGAPRIGDRAAWTPRLSKGLDALVRSAVHGHGPMPARGGLADLSDVEIHGAVVYMFNYGIPEPPPPAPPVAANPYHKVVSGTDIYLGIVRAQSMPADQRKGGAAPGKDDYHVNISLFDSKTQTAVSGAQVTVRVADALSGATKTLAPIAANDTVSYGGYFRMVGPEPYTITAQVRRPGVAAVLEAKFEYKVW